MSHLSQIPLSPSKWRHQLSTLQTTKPSLVKDNNNATNFMYDFLLHMCRALLPKFCKDYVSSALGPATVMKSACPLAHWKNANTIKNMDNNFGKLQ